MICRPTGDVEEAGSKNVLGKRSAFSSELGGRPQDGDVRGGRLGKGFIKYNN